MKTNSRFDDKLEGLTTHVSLGNSVLSGTDVSNLHQAAIFVTDTLDLCLAAAEAVFEEKATPELALAMYDRMVEHLQTISKK